MAGVLALYPLRLLYYSRSREPPSNRRYRQRIRIPAAFDPAPILYPAILPVLISISLYASSEKILLPNIMLGLAALPPQLIPFAQSHTGISAVHWFVSILPLIASEWPSEFFPTIFYKPKAPLPKDGLHPELLVCLFALHHALLPPLHYLTTTSLLPAELHLLSIGLINLLLFAESPQAVILQTLLWLGGVGLFVTCGKVLKWGVALARIPRWRFRHVGHVIKARQNFLQVLNDTLKPRSRSAARAISDSDADEDDYALSNPLSKAQNLKLNTRFSTKSPFLANGDIPSSAVEHKQAGFSESGDKADPAASPRRRYTLPSLPSQHPPPRQPTHRHRSKSTAQSFLSFTPTQAFWRKWIYAGYFYLVVILIILLPIRYIISTRALNNHEPFSWAVGYLFGNIQPLRFAIFDWGLDSWVPLPPLEYKPYLSPSNALPQSLGIVEHLRTDRGPATTRLLLILYFLLIIVLGLLIVLSPPLTKNFEVDTRRKVFHGMMVGMLLPTIFIDPLFISLALSLVLSIFLLLDLIRASQLPPLSNPIAKFLTPYVDGRDLRGPVVVSHIFLLIGCAIPLWLSLAGVNRVGEEPWTGWEVEVGSRDVSLIAGVVCVGMGDAAASLIGRRWGRRKWPWVGGKSLEGSAAFAVAVTIGLTFGKGWLRVGGWEGGNGGVVPGWGDLKEWGIVVLKAGLCAMGASLNEAVLTGGNDNVVVPVVLWVLVRGVDL
jgi:dolichol kinase